MTAPALTMTSLSQQHCAMPMNVLNSVSVPNDRPFDLRRHLVLVPICVQSRGVGSKGPATVLTTHKLPLDLHEAPWPLHQVQSCV